MSTHQPFLTTAQGTRRFACSAVAVQAIIVNGAEQVLLLSSPTKNRPDEWQIISGGLEASETVLAGVLRDTFHRITWWSVSPAHRKPPEVRICRLSIQSCVGTRPPSTSTPH
jgi:hypothetical protein